MTTGIVPLKGGKYRRPAGSGVGGFNLGCTEDPLHHWIFFISNEVWRLFVKTPLPQRQQPLRYFPPKGGLSQVSGLARNPTPQAGEKEEAQYAPASFLWSHEMTCSG